VACHLLVTACRWSDITDALHPGHAAENARRMQAATFEMAWEGSSDQQQQQQQQQQQTGSAVHCKEEMRAVLEQAGASITEV
jgi:hypothetical protein